MKLLNYETEIRTNILDKVFQIYNSKFLGVSKAVKNVNNIISPKFIELKLSFLDSQSKIDKFLIELDGTPNKGIL